MVELLITITITLILMMVVFNFFNLSKLVYSYGLAGQMLQDGDNIVINKIIGGKTEPGGIYRLAQSASYCIGTQSGATSTCSTQFSPTCNTTTTGELHFCGYPDYIERSVRLDATATQLIYHHPVSPSNNNNCSVVFYNASSYNVCDEVVYTAPKGATITLRFWIPAVANYPAAVVGMDAALIQSVFGRSVTGSSTTIVNLRNHP